MPDQKRIEQDIRREFDLRLSDLCGHLPKYEIKDGWERILPLEFQSLNFRLGVARYSRNGKIRARATETIRASGVPAMLDALQDELIGIVDIAAGMKEEIQRLRQKISRL